MVSKHIRRIGGATLVTTALFAAPLATTAHADTTRAPFTMQEEGAPPVSLGDQDNVLVEWWQDRLNQWLQLTASDMYPIAVDGWFGPQTEAATLEFQRAMDGLEANAVVQPVDRVALDDELERLRGDGSPPVGVGDEGTLVAWWQDRLNEWLRLSGSDRFPITVDGRFTEQTEDATLEFQRAMGALDANGIVQPADRVALENAIERFAQPPTPVDEFSTEARSAEGDADGVALLTKVHRDSYDGFERIVFEFGAAGTDISYDVEYVQDPPVGPTNDPVTVDGGAMLQVHARPASGFDMADQVATYTGPQRFELRVLDTVTEAARVEDFEANKIWLIGLDQERPFAVNTWDDPLRLVIDIETADGEA